MSLARRAVVVGHGLFTSAVAAAFLPGALAFPAVAETLTRAHPSAWWLDGTLCFGPLLVPGLLALSAVALRSAWERDPDALRLNVSALAGWAVALVAGAATVGLA